jgi:hypothetical protein
MAKKEKTPDEIWKEIEELLGSIYGKANDAKIKSSQKQLSLPMCLRSICRTVLLCIRLKLLVM